MTEHWEPDPYVEPASYERQEFEIVVIQAQVEISHLYAAREIRSYEQMARDAVVYQVRAHAAQRILESAQVEWPDGWREAVKEAVYPRIRRVLQVLMPMQGTRLADRIERRWPVRYQRRRMIAAEWAHRRFLERDSSRVAIEVLKPVPTRMV